MDRSANGDYGVRWRESNRSGRIVTKEKFFSDDRARQRFTDRLEKSDNFIEFVGWSDPRTASRQRTALKPRDLDWIADVLQNQREHMNDREMADQIAQVQGLNRGDGIELVMEWERGRGWSKAWNRAAMHKWVESHLPVTASDRGGMNVDRIAVAGKLVRLAKALVEEPGRVRKAKGMEDLPTAERKVAEKMKAKGYRYCYQVTTVDGDFGDPLYAKNSSDVGPMLRSFPDYKNAKMKWIVDLGEPDRT